MSQDKEDWSQTLFLSFYRSSSGRLYHPLLIIIKYKSNYKAIKSKKKSIMKPFAIYFGLN